MMDGWLQDETVRRWGTYVLTFGIATAVSLLMTPRIREAAIRFGIVDHPDGKLKTHREPVAYLGGLAISLSCFVALAITVPFNHQVLGILLAGAIVVVLGMLDDLGGLGPWAKLAGQLVAVTVLIKAGLFIQLTFVPVPLAIALTVWWLLAVTNAFNLIDIMDGLSAGTAATAAIVLGIVAEMNQGIAAATILAAIAGACIGFLRYNFQPAKIYMGDTGSMFLGISLGALAMDNAYTARNDIAAIAPALILGVPLFDMVFVMYVRWRRGLPVMIGSPDHVALRLRKWKLSTRQTVVASYVVTAILGAAAIAITLLPQQGALWVLGGLAIIGLVVAIWLKTIDMNL
ncbi:MAG: undecaprenyl/decaprenyl-phosphate alpha-N-acetylglucosaminyl 1-phosphate transferase [Acidobacteriota bacterium]|nr:undecaprenyl/decaprenyl-phosphate alpha-N-acetylglucosaminyl 1-phosphate transferase [Acidobacteriota bacterium]MDH3783947.1 undecaprenyl/decaprenyl-phosphate alpha-N-acetylglucosaminyl 1-phosphate transferase [Acidobacteriota bacterium]